MEIPRCALGILSVIMFVMLALLIFFGISLVYPYMETKDFIAAECTPLNITDHGLQFCDCGGDNRCVSRFPCLEITVSVRPTSDMPGYISKITKQFTEDFEAMKCSVFPCKPSEFENSEIVSEFSRDYGRVAPSPPYDCFYNPEKPREVVVEIPSRIAVIMAMFWPSLMLSICIIITTVLFCRACRKTEKYV